MEDRLNGASDQPDEEPTDIGTDITFCEQEMARAELADRLEAEMDKTDDTTSGNVIDEISVKEAEKKRSSRLDIYDWIQSIISTLIVVIIAFIFIGRQIGVDGVSMRDTLHHEDSVFVTSMFYTPHYGDIVIIKVEEYGDIPLVKRVIATEGQTIDINFETHEVLVNGNVLNEPYIKEPTVERLNFAGAVTVPEGCVFVMGDNRNASRDSRDMSIGFVDVRNIIGKVHFVLLPGANEYKERDWSRIGSVYKTMP